MGQLLLVDDDPDLILAQMNQVFGASQHRIDVARTGAEGIRRVAKPHAGCRPARPPTPRPVGAGGLPAKWSPARRRAIPVIFVPPTWPKAADAAIEATRGRGPSITCSSQLERPAPTAAEWSARHSRGGDPADGAEPAVIAETTPDPGSGRRPLSARCPAMREVYKAIGRVAAQDVPVLITGESGTGKGLVARGHLPARPPSQGARFWPSTARHPGGNLLERQAVRLRKGTFTGAWRGVRIGKFEQCSGGTLVLDEIGDMPLASSRPDLRLLQEQAFSDGSVATRRSGQTCS